MSTLLEIYGISITPQAKAILDQCITAIVADPDDSWPFKADQSKLEKFQTDMLDALPSTLAQVFNRRKITKITSFNLLHSLTEIIDRICPIDKPPS
jgi:hypothetical protein